MIFDKGVQTIQWKKDNFSVLGKLPSVLGKLYIHMQKDQLRCLPLLIHISLESGSNKL